MPKGIKGFLKGWKAKKGMAHWRFKDGRKKPCLTCKKIITAPYPRNCRNCWRKSMLGKIPENCVNTGRTRFKKGSIAWNKGIEWKEMQGKNNPSYIHGKTRPLARKNCILSGPDCWKKRLIQRVYESNILKHGELTCNYCEERIDFGKDTIDHVIPTSRGGRDIFENIVIACFSCNSSKRDKLLSEWPGNKKKNGGCKNFLQ